MSHLPPPGCQTSHVLASHAGGNVSILFALAAMAVALAAGMAIDTVRLYAARTALTAAADTAALQVASARNLTGARLEAMAREVIERNFDQRRHGPIGGMTLAVRDDRVSLSVHALFPTSFMRLAGIETVRLPAETEVVRAGNSLEVALILDVTASMTGNRLRALKEAATDFVDTVVWETQGQFTAKVALVPYAMGVNLGSRAAEARGSVSPGTCTVPGCQYYRFRNKPGASRTLSISTCVSERTGPQAYTDAPVAASPVGRNYASPANPCPDSGILPLSRDRTALRNAIAALQAGGSTAAQVGVAWGWYALSPRIGLWSGDSRPAAYDDRKTSKIAVIMSDGEFNSAYCNGVIARNSLPGSGADEDKINCDATNGGSYAQVRALCQAMKQHGITIYTIAFDLWNSPEALGVMTACASSPAHLHLAAGPAELKAAFAAIGRKVSALRIAR